MSGLKRGYIKDCKDNLRSGSGQLNRKYWQECHELWGGGAAGTEPLDFGNGDFKTQKTEIVDEEKCGQGRDLKGGRLVCRYS